MALQIRISPDALRSAAEQQREIRESIVASLGAMEDIRTILTESWEGMAATQALNALEDIRAAAKRVGEGVNEDAAKLNDIVSAFEALDSEGPVAVIRKLPTGFVPMPILPAFLWAQPGSVRIVPDSVRDAAARCQKQADKFYEARDRFKQIVENLKNDWEGKACNKYVDESAEVVTALYQVGEALSELSNKLRSAATKYEELDNSL